MDSLLTAHRVPHHLVFFPHSGHMLGRDPGQARQFVSLAKCRTAETVVSHG